MFFLFILFLPFSFFVSKMSDGCSLRLPTLGLIPTMASYSSTGASSRSCFGRWCSFTLKALKECVKKAMLVKSKRSFGVM